MTEEIGIPEYKKPTLSDEWKQEQLDAWQGRCPPTPSDDVKREIKMDQAYRKRDARRLENLRNYVNNHYPGFDEWAEGRIARLEMAIEYWDECIAFNKWLLKQPRER